ncbi:MAG TPA: chromosome segregation protein SMC, partial [Gemmatimonadetes bacterium]|nr:chromosome segregation protein SMC [Gemmatimonadota bacterium]
MKLRSLRVHGFKSFADATTIEFHDGITAVVGPNGCGKSNISDAIRWVLGEQRPTAIRGAKMEEVIFQGTVGRRPVNRGSVSLTVTNEDGTLPIPFQEVEVGRQVFRDGGSEYSINRSACRLRDIVDLCRDTGLGANAYSIIENRMIDAILSDRAEERRSLFEEAAGVGKYKDRRKAATRKLERAEIDVQRLEDVISEVQTKVRSLARQKGKAQRFVEYRQRRLDVEVTVVRRQLDMLRERLTGVQESLDADARSGGEDTVVELHKAEAEYESMRLREVEAEKERTAVAKTLEKVREQLVRWERDLAVADERAAYAGRRLAQIDEERAQARQQAEALVRDERALTGTRTQVLEELESIQRLADERKTKVGRLHDDMSGARKDLEKIETQERELARRGAQLEGDAEASDAQADELERRLSRVSKELDATDETFSELQAQSGLFERRLEDSSDVLENAVAQVEQRTGDIAAARGEFNDARRVERTAIDLVAGLAARLSALEVLERDQEGLEPVVRALLESGVKGVLGTLADYIQASAEITPPLESYLGTLTRAIVVNERKTVDSVVRWFTERWEGGGGLIVLPLDMVPQSDTESSGELLSQINTRGAGAPWVKALLDGVQVHQGVDGACLTSADGVVRIGNPSGGAGILERKEELRKIREALDTGSLDEESACKECEARERKLAGAEEMLVAARLEMREAEDALHKMRAEIEMQSDEQSRIHRLHADLAREIGATNTARDRVLERAREARADRGILLEQEEGLGEEREQAQDILELAQDKWETARAEETRLAVDVARLQGDVTRLKERFETLGQARYQAEQRVSALDAEESKLREDQAEARRIRSEGDTATERLFEERSTAENEVRDKDDVLQGLEEALGKSEKHLREARTVERAASDRRHTLELEHQELDGRIDRIRERLEIEWGRPLETLLQEASLVEGDKVELETELSEIVQTLERIGPVNMLAVEEHEEESERLRFLTEQRDDLQEARDDLRSAIREINTTATNLFVSTFEEIRKHFRKTFLRLFEGGEADIRLQVTDDPLESPIEIHASPRGKRTRRIDLLSGGERALTALSLLFGIYLVKPSPFCVLDEVDAPLDENNIGRFIKLLEDYKADSQFVVITHNPRTIEAADWI